MVQAYPHVIFDSFGSTKQILEKKQGLFGPFEKKINSHAISFYKIWEKLKNSQLNMSFYEVLEIYQALLW